MKTQDAPSVKDYSAGILKESTSLLANRQQYYWLLGILITLVFLLLGIIGFQNLDFSVFTKKGVVYGQVTDGKNNPLKADVFILGTNARVKADKEGYFKLTNVPVGEQTIILAYEKVGIEIDLEVAAKEEYDIGIIALPTNQKRFID